jgi:hypothetical protein
MNRNYQTPVNLAEATKRWGAIVEKLGITDPNQKLKMVEYAQIHADTLQSGMIKENAGGVAFSGIANTAGMGAVVNPTFSGTPGLPGGAGSGDIAQTLLPGSSRARQLFQWPISKRMGAGSGRILVLLPGAHLRPLALGKTSSPPGHS